MSKTHASKPPEAQPHRSGAGRSKASAKRSGSRGIAGFGLLLLAVAGFGAFQGWRWWSWASGPVLAAPTEADAAESLVQLEIESGTSAYEIGRQLEAAGLIRSTRAWDLWVKSQSLRQKLGQETGEFQAGIYELSPTSSLSGLANQIRQGDVIQAQFTIPEGWNIRQMAAYFEDQGFFSAEDWLAAARQIPRDRFAWLPDDLPHLEGYLFPDTYQIDYALVTPEAIVETMLLQFEKNALPIYQAADTEMSLDEWVTFASIVEKEAVVPDERSLISGVLAHRLRIGKRLEVDPTVEYGLGISQTPDRTLTFAEVATPSPYNSYLNPGLPPTAIASPGVASLEATLTPEDTDFLFYVARYDGTHVFSRTFEEHLAAQDAIHDAREAKQAAESRS